jgi:cis-3-alkyl-4-acyloxetan-2-one decarboxylase
MNNSLQIDDVDVLVEGAGAHAVVMLHGWPDTPALWDDTVAALRDGYRCVRFCLPGYDLTRPPRPVSVDAMCGLVRKIVDAVSPHEPVTLLLHDWGCFFGYEFAARHPDRVARVIGVDIGDTSSGAYLKGLSGKEKRMIAYYQIWLALAWKIGPWWPGLANRMSRYMARSIGCRSEPARIGWQMNYPYAMQWFGAHGGLRVVARVDKLLGVSMPALYIYGRRKPFMFHSARWIEQLTQAPGCEVLALDTGHWVMRQKPAEFNACVRAWLDRATATSA